jgi:hypothetical protein
MSKTKIEFQLPLEAITPIQECNQNCPPFPGNDWPYPRNATEIVHPYLGNDRPFPKSATKF